MKAVWNAIKTAFFFIGLVSILPSVCSAQQRTVIKGNVKDSLGVPVLFANVFVKGATESAVTDSAGNYRLATSDSGKIILCVKAVGYTLSEQELLLSGNEVSVNFIMHSLATELTTVTITAGSFEAGDEKKSVVMKSRDISTTAGGNGDISSVMNTLPGTQKIGEEEGLFVRGGSGMETKTIIDEMIVQAPFFSSAPDVPQKGRFSPFLFKGTLFSTGGYSAMYGQALSSVLILNTDDLPENSFTSIGILPFGGSLGHTERMKKSSLAVEGSYADMKPYFSVMPQLTDWDREPVSANASLFYKKKISDYGMFKFYGYGSSTALSLYSPNPDNAADKIKFSNENRNYYAFTNYRNSIGKWRYFIGASYAYDNDHKFIDSVNISSLKNLSQGKIILKRQIFKNGSDLKFGAELQSNSVHSVFDSTEFNINELYHAVFTEGEFYISRKFGIRAGVRYEYSDLIPVVRLSPRVSMAYKLGESSSISLAYGDFYQNPDNRYLLINEHLGSEHARHYILSYQAELKKRLFRFELYDKEYDGLIKYSPDSMESTLSNSGYGYARGMDIFWRDNKITIKNLDYWISYSYLITKRNYLNFPVLATPGFAPVHNLSVVCKYNIKKIKSHVGFTYLYASGRTYFNPGLPDDLFNSEKTPDYHNLSLTISKYGFIRGKHFYVIYASVNNILNRKNVFGYRYSSDGQNRIEVGSGSLRSFFIGMFISLERKK